MKLVILLGCSAALLLGQDVDAGRKVFESTCGRCHAGANVKFVQYQPHANAHDRKLNPALYFVRLFMNLLLAGVLTFFVIHTILWLVRSRYDQVKHKTNGGNHA